MQTLEALPATIDEPAAESRPETIETADTQAPEADAEPREEHSLTHHVVEIGSDVELLHLNPPAIEFGEVKPIEGESEETAEEELPKEELKDASAKIRQRSRRGEMATRRGGRGRRRTFPRRGGANDATTDEEDDGQDDQDEVIAPVLAPQLLSRAPERQAERQPERQPERLSDRGADRFHRPIISDLLREGQEIIVQIAKEPIVRKARASHRTWLCPDVTLCTC